ncbi:ABC transporter substrate-binding protein [uncultured Microbacterium sp.]|uniref:ABC transporter substrate-binding protein n=1 Tax=uncultured Microbacterium sp. TaxID=191216 RepID=UPI0035C9597A
MFHTRKRAFLAIGAAAATFAVLLTSGCSGSSNGGSSGGDITLKLSTFGNFGYTDELLAEYEKSHPGIKVEQSISASSEDSRTNVFTKLAAGSGLADIEAIEGGWTLELGQYADKFVPVEDDEYGDWIDFQTAQVKTKDGGLWAYGVATGPEAICYRADMFEAAGLPSDPEGVAKLLGTSWDDYFAAGKKYVAGGGPGKFFDSAITVFEAQMLQLPNPFEEDDGTIIATGPQIEDIFRSTLEAAPALSAAAAPYTDDWAAATANGGFATLACPSWMLGLIEGNSPKVTGWNVANTFPGGGGNTGGSFLAVPTQSQHPKEASELASWLTSPEVQVKAFETAGPFPSRVKAFDLPELTSYVNPFFNNAPVGQIFSDQSKADTVIAFKGVNFAKLALLASDAVARVDSGTQSIDDAWNQYVSEVDAVK